jgi:hypothetical protein
MLPSSKDFSKDEFVKILKSQLEFLNKQLANLSAFTPFVVTNIIIASNA